MRILTHKDFRTDDVVSNVRRLRKMRQRLPLLKMSEHPVHISNKQTPSTSEPVKSAYSISLLDYISRVLSTPSLASEMYFGPGVLMERRSEFWHGRIWHESPLFGQDSVKIRGGN